jgi:predicted peroxiredoxin
MRTFANLSSSLSTVILSVSLILGGTLGIVGLACVKGESLVPAAQAGQEKQKVVINLKQGTNDLRAATMALELAVELVDKGAEVTIYANLEGVRLLDARQPDQSCGAGETIGQLYQRFIAGGGQILVCPLCAEQAGIRPDNIRAGARLGDMAQVADLLLVADVVIDY